MKQQFIFQNILVQLKKQLNSFFVDVDMSVIESKVEEAYQRCMISIAASNNKYLNPDGIPLFKLEHSGCWSIFLYYLSNSLKKSGGGQNRFII